MLPLHLRICPFLSMGAGVPGVITVRDGKREKDRIVPLLQTVVPGLRRQIERLDLLHEEDLVAGFGLPME